MSNRPDIPAALAPGETLRWQGFPQPGRRIPVRAAVFASIFFMATVLLLVFAWYLAIFKQTVPGIHLVVYGLIGSAAFLTYLGLRLSLLDRRRARARDARTAYGVTDRRALVRAGPYTAEVALTPGVVVRRSGDSLTIEGKTSAVRFERLNDAPAARDILIAQIEGGT